MDGGRRRESLIACLAWPGLYDMDMIRARERLPWSRELRLESGPARATVEQSSNIE